MPQFINSFYNQINPTQLSITSKQGSDFAKNIAKDFNPLHNADSKRFCVPGDLLLALTLQKYGLYQNMSFDFQGMVGKDTQLVFPENSSSSFELKDINDKTYLASNFSGEVQTDTQIIESFIREFVTLSGESFLNQLVPLMRENQVLINIKKPMVIYNSMEFNLTNLNPTNLKLRFTDTQLEQKGKRGKATLKLGIFDGDKQIGSGSKTMILSGLRPLVEEDLQSLIEDYKAAASSSPRAS